MNINLHTHTFRNHHATGEERDYAEYAISCGIHTLGFSEHAPYRFLTVIPPGGTCSLMKWMPMFLLSSP